MKFPLSSSGRRRLLAAASAGALVVAGLVAVAAPAHAAVACQVGYQPTWDNGGGFGADVTLTNLGDPVDGWSLTFAFPGNQQVTHGWTAVWSQAGPTVTARNESWNASLGTGASLTAGFNGSYTGSNQPPSQFFLNGVECTGDPGGGGGDPAILADPGSLAVPEGGSGQVTFSLSEAPASAVTVSLGATGDPNISAAPVSLSFDSGNWDTGLAVTVNAAEDDDQTSGTATLTATAAGHQPASVAITEIDNDQPPGGGSRVDNPYLGADVYVNPDWRAAAQDGGAPASIFNQPTGVWLDRIAAIESGSAGSNVMGLADHLDAALAQDAANGATPLVFQVVIYNLPGRDCAALASNGELGPNDLPIYQSDYIDVIAGIMSRPQYADLRIATIIEIDSLPNLVTNTSGQPGATALCDQMLANGGYVNGVGYALGTLGAIPNVHNYVDAAHHGWIGWDSNFNPTADIILQAANANGAEPSDVHGFITNTANYSALTEPFIDINGTVNGQQIRQSAWVDFNQFNDEQPFAQAFRNRLDQIGFAADVGMLIDTSRNGWGGAARPTGPSDSTDLNTFVNESRIDRRIHKGNWCNQSGAGLGERPQAAPAPGIDAYVWIKPPGESDGSSEPIDNDEGKGFDQMCDPTYQGNARNGNSPSGALPDAPLSGHWFQAQFDELLANAWPPVS
ncbi:MAG: cellulose 1,4-beta-cellobiosidase [Micromonosporaceae bacterium]|nr:cellulose 1,4-beta-cellobiosidase [Micromonosporaceae bacterium]